MTPRLQLQFEKNFATLPADEPIFLEEIKTGESKAIVAISSQDQAQNKEEIRHQRSQIVATKADQ